MAIDFDNLFGGDRGREILQNPPKQATVIVAKDGSGDTDDIADGIKLLPTDGGIVQVKAGTYIITVPIEITGNNITLQGVGWGTKIYSGGNIKLIHLNGCEGVVIKDLLVYGSNVGAGQYGIYLTNGDVNIIQNCRIYNCRAGELYLDGSSSKNIITNCHISGFLLGGDCVYIAGDNNSILANQIWEAGSNGILLYDCINNTLNGNVIKTCTNDGISINAASDNIVNGCVSKLNDEYGVELEGAGENDNIVTSCNLDANGIAGILDNGVGTTAANNEV